MQRRPPKLWIFSILNMPHSVVIGGVAGTLLSYLLRQQGVSPHNIADEYSLLLLPGALFFLWSPLSDFFLRRRTWVLVASAAAGMAVTLALQMKSYASSAAIALLFGAASLIYLSSAATGGIVAALVLERDKTRAGCFMQAGTLAGGALGGGGLLMLASHVDKLTLGIAAGVVVFAPAMLALLIDEPPIARGDTSFAEGMLQRAKEFKRTFLRLSALPAVLLLVSPLGSGGALGILSSIARDYGVSANLVALANGLGGAALTFAGAMVMTLMPARYDVRKAYAILGLINALSLGIFCFGTPKPWMYLVGSSLYLFTVGACWAMYSALVLKIVGAPGRSGSSRYAMAVSLANLPVAYMARLDGFGAKWFGPKGLPGIDMVFSATAALAFLGWFWWERVKGFEVDIGLPEESSAQPAPLSA